MKKNLVKNMNLTLKRSANSFNVFKKNIRPEMFAALPLETVKMKSSGALISSLLDGLLALSAGMAILFLIVGGIKYVRSLGDAEQLRKAKRSIYLVVLGLAVILVSYAAVVTLNKIVQGT